jgi:hypothetical protein
LERAIITILLTCSPLALGEIYYPLEKYAIYSLSLGKVAEDTWCMALLAVAIYIAALLMIRIGEKRFLGKNIILDILPGVIKSPSSRPHLRSPSYRAQSASKVLLILLSSRFIRKVIWPKAMLVTVSLQIVVL